jgi:hypothetical protein
MFTDCKNSKAQGNIGVALAISYFVKLGCTISIPLNDSQEYDLVVDIDGFLNKVQVKTTNSKTPDNNYIATLRNSGGSTRKVYGRVCDSEIDILFVVTAEGTMYNFPFIEIQHLVNSITLGKKYQDFIVS